jgi:hypothetical protein
LLPLSEDVVAPGEFPVQMKTETFDVISCGKLYVVQVYRRALACARGECNVDRLAVVRLHAPLEEPGMKSENMNPVRSSPYIPIPGQSYPP